MKCPILLCSKYHNNMVEQHGKIARDDDIKLAHNEYFIHDFASNLLITNHGGLCLDGEITYPNNIRLELTRECINAIKGVKNSHATKRIIIGWGDNEPVYVFSECDFLPFMSLNRIENIIKSYQSHTSTTI